MGWTRHLLSAAAAVGAVAVSLTVVGASGGAGAAVTNGGLGWSDDRFTATQRLDLLTGDADELPGAVGPDAVFNAGGDAILSYRGGTMYVLHASGVVDGFAASSAPTALHGVILSWAADESYAVVGTEDGIFRVVRGERPVELPGYFGGGVPRSGDGAMAFTDYPDDHHVAIYVADPLHPEAGRTQISPSWCTVPIDTGLCSPGDSFVPSIYPIAWDAAGERLLVGYDTVDAAGYVPHLGWFVPGSATFDDLPFDGSGAREIFLSPDNALLAYNRGTGRKESTRVIDLADGSLVTELAGHHWGWQPCAGTCATFDEPVSPSRVPIGTASSGAQGGRTTAVVRWRAPTDAGTSPVDHYFLQATPAGPPAGRHRATKERGAAARSYTWHLPAGRWKFRVCAYNTASPYCTISRYSNVVRSR